MAAAANPGPSVRICIATINDIVRMVPVVNAAFAVETFIEGPRTNEREMQELMRKGEFLLAEDLSGRIVACVSTECRGERGYFGMLAVDPSQQGKGLGRLMVEAAEKHFRLRGCRFVDIAVLNRRPELPPYYRKLGYVESGAEEIVPPLLKDGGECYKILMTKAL